MKTENLRNFIIFQFSVLLLMLTTLPEINILEALGVDMFDFKEAVCKIVGVVFAAKSLKFFMDDFKAEGKELQMPLLVSAGIGLVLALITIIPSIPMWVEIIGFVALTVALILSKKSLEVEFANDGVKGAYMILLAILLNLFNDIDGTLLVSIASLVGFFIYWSSLGKLSNTLDETGGKATSKLKTAIILSIIGVVLGFIPVLGLFIAAILGVIAFFMQYKAYGILSTSSSLNEEGQAGALKLRTSMIILLVGSILGIIPVAGDMIQGFLAIVALWFVFKGWSSIMLSLNYMATFTAAPAEIAE